MTSRIESDSSLDFSSDQSAKISREANASLMSGEISTSTSDPPLFVCIIGGGLAGLSCALSLQAVGIKCRVFERDESISQRKQGFGLTLTNSRVGALAQLGVLDQCLEQDCASVSHYVFDHRGGILGYFGRAFLTEDELKHKRARKVRDPADEKLSERASDSSLSQASSTPCSTPPARWWRSANLRVPRQSLRQMLFDRLEPDTVTWGARILDFVETEDHVKVTFQDGSVLYPDLLVGADGINSVVRKLQDQKANEKVGKLRYLGVAVIIGLSTLSHPLLHERGFYAMGNQHRLFTMPFRAVTYNKDGTIDQPPLTMWQLSFAETSESKAQGLGSTPPTELLASALARTKGWMDPIESLLTDTPLEGVWATPLYDRDARRLRNKQQASRVTVVGDACHPMSMFKGQGANQALQDGPLLARMLTVIDRNTPPSSLDALGRPLLERSALLNRIRRFESQMVQRTDTRVKASRVAAANLHSQQVSDPSDFFGIAGVSLSSEQLALVLETCRQKHIGAHLNERLDEVFGNLLDITVPPSQRGSQYRTNDDGME